MPVQGLEGILAAHPLFRRFDAETIAALAGCARNERFEAGARIFTEGDPADRLHLLRRGDVAIEISTPEKQPMIVETLHEGDIVGWSWIVPPYRHMADARALSAVSSVSLDSLCMRRKCDANPAIGYAMFQHWLPHLAARVQAQRLQLLDLYGRRAG